MQLQTLMTILVITLVHGIEAELTLNFGTYASEISWAFVTSDGEPIVQGGGYGNDDNNTSPSFDLCLQA